MSAFKIAGGLQVLHVLMLSLFYLFIYRKLFLSGHYTQDQCTNRNLHNVVQRVEISVLCQRNETQEKSLLVVNHNFYDRGVM